MLLLLVSDRRADVDELVMKQSFGQESCVYLYAANAAASRPAQCPISPVSSGVTVLVAVRRDLARI